MHAVVPKASLDYDFAPMHIEYLAKAYEAKTDEELLQLAGEANDLTPNAFTALRSEMARRRIDAPDLVPDALKAGAIRQSPGAFSGVEATSVAEFVAEAIGVYHRQFWLFLSLVAPAVAIGWFAVVMGRNESREIARHIPRGIEVVRHPAELTEMAIANLAGLFGSWTAFSFSFAGICVAVRNHGSRAIHRASASFQFTGDSALSYAYLRCCLPFCWLWKQLLSRSWSLGFSGFCGDCTSMLRGR
jgi:hypothetical protein